MDLVKRNAFMIACVVGGIAGVALAVTGLNAMPEVKKEMEKAQAIYRSLDGLKGSPANQDIIDAEQDRIDQTIRDHDEVSSNGVALFKYQPLVENVFPDGDDDTRRAFRTRYEEAMNQLLDPEVLRWGSGATETDRDVIRDKIVEEQYRAKEHGLDPNAPTPAQIPSGPDHTPSGCLTIDGARTNVEARAEMVAAQRIYLYAMPFKVSKRSKAVPSLEFDPTMEDTGTVDAPFHEDCWIAQFGYWIQKDVVDAIVAINNGAVEELKAQGKARWVGTMPVKEIISVRVLPEYVPADSDDEIVGGPAEGFTAANPAGVPSTVFTRSGQSDLFDVVQFSVKLVMDQRDIPLFAEELTKNSFHTLLRVAYSQVTPNKRMVGKIYGSEPAVIVVFDFETIMLGEVFRKWMPIDVCDRFEIDCPSPEGEEETEEG